MEDADVVVLVAREQGLDLRIGSRRVADQHAVFGRYDRADPFDRGDWQFDDVA
ncbi:hypothetical protein MesoLj131b_69660 (plasmid) [Mesorhizobium sp. 131-2-5]|uniref:hypothetical protein n=1 Tax=Mesorhizobium sp. 131-2-5 TaxID=2744519 RepID=UPI0019362129|nr:hypothetical protein [Mesorhizobium sp. 131-2-5]BCH04967.1 hypothetical protein MesoLj131b_69660 [Mesorhizobium sp. 131-2-5]